MSHIDQITYSVFARFDLELSAQWGIIGKKDEMCPVMQFNQDDPRDWSRSVYNQHPSAIVHQ